MKKISISNLGLIVTNKCNLDCKHCLRGCKNNQDMTKEVIEATLDQITGIGNLCLCGGEVTLSLDTIKYIFDYFIKNKIIIDRVNTTINGTIYSKELIELFEYINRYINQYSNADKPHVSIAISNDIYHEEEMERLKLINRYDNNVDKYMESEFFLGVRTLEKSIKLIREGHACNLDKRLTKPLKPMNFYVTYTDDKKKFDRMGLCNVGPLVTINPNGIITECNASIENQESKYNYGNVLDNRIEIIASTHGKVLKPNKWYRMCNREINKYLK